MKYVVLDIVGGQMGLSIVHNHTGAICFLKIFIRMHGSNTRTQCVLQIQNNFLNSSRR